MIEAPAELRERNQWVCWRYQISVSVDGETRTKVPINARSGHRASTTDPSTWASYLEANAYADMGLADGIGYVLSEDDPYSGVDLDHCRDPVDGTIEGWAKAIVFRLGSYTEISPSGTGLRIFVKGDLPPHGRHKGNIEVYCKARFLTITGFRYGASPNAINARQAELTAWHREVFGEPVAAGARVNGHARAATDLDDVEILERAHRASNGDKFWGLWNGDWSSAYGSQSEADLALANFLAFWCGPDPGRIERLFELSGLMRDKWADRPEYRAWTIDKALNGRTDYYDPRYRSNGHTDGFGVGANASVTPPPPDEGEPLESGWDVMSAMPEKVSEIVEHFLWRGLTHWVYSAPSAGKTLFKLAQLMHVAAGLPFHGFAVVQGPVVILEEDSPRAVISDYLHTLADIYDIDMREVPLYFFKKRGVTLKTQADYEYAKRCIASAKDKPLVFLVDACERVVPSESFTSRELEWVTKIFAENAADGIANVMIDHTRKPQAGGEKVDPLELLYGSRAKSAISDVMTYVSGSIKQRAMLSFPKFRGVTPGAVHISFDGASGFSIVAQKAPLTESQQKVMMVINNALGVLLTRAEVAERAGLGDKTTLRTLNQLIEIGFVSRHGDNIDAVYGVSHSGVGGPFS